MEAVRREIRAPITARDLSRRTQHAARAIEARLAERADVAAAAAVLAITIDVGTVRARARGLAAGERPAARVAHPVGADLGGVTRDAARATVLRIELEIGARAAALALAGRTREDTCARLAARTRPARVAARTAVAWVARRIDTDATTLERGAGADRCVERGRSPDERLPRAGRHEGPGNEADEDRSWNACAAELPRRTTWHASESTEGARAKVNRANIF